MLSSINQVSNPQYFGEKEAKKSVNPATAKLLQYELRDLQMNPLENVVVTQSYLGDFRNPKSDFCTWNVTMKIPRHKKEHEGDEL